VPSPAMSSRCLTSDRARLRTAGPPRPCAWGTVGKAAEARAVFDELSARSQCVYVPAYDIALVCAGFGWKDQALDYLARALQERSGWMTYLKVDPRLDPLRGDARFVELLRRMRLAP
jgi:hypothetical protein